MAKSHQDNFPSTDRLSIKLERRDLVVIRDTLIFHFIISYFLLFIFWLQLQSHLDHLPPVFKQLTICKLDHIKMYSPSPQNVVKSVMWQRQSSTFVKYAEKYQVYHFKYSAMDIYWWSCKVSTMIENLVFWPNIEIEEESMHHLSKGYTFVVRW